MQEVPFSQMKDAILAHVDSVFHEIEDALALQHQEKYTLLEDACENATDVEELHVAFQQWFAEHVDELQLEQTSGELWDGIMAHLEDEDLDEY